MKTDREKDSADPDRNGLEAGVADNNQERGELIKRMGNKNDFAIFTSDFIGYYLQNRTYSVGVTPYFFRKQRLK